jgi:hypothetical protein
VESAAVTSSRRLRPLSAATSSTSSTFMDGSGRSSSRPGPATAIKSTPSTHQHPQQERGGVAALDSDREADRRPTVDHSLQRSAHRHVQRHSSGGALAAMERVSQQVLRSRPSATNRPAPRAAGGRRPGALTGSPGSRIEAFHLAAYRCAAAGVGRHPDIVSRESQRTIILRPAGRIQIRLPRMRQGSD